MIKKAIDIVTRYSLSHDIPLTEVLGKGRSKSVVKIRRGAIQDIRSQTDLSLPEIGKLFGGRHHATILHYLKT